MALLFGEQFLYMGEGRSHKEGSSDIWYQCCRLLGLRAYNYIPGHRNGTLQFAGKNMLL